MSTALAASHPRDSGREASRRLLAVATSVVMPGNDDGIRSHGHADTGLELAREDHLLGHRLERNRPEGAAAAGAELDLEPARDASAAGASGAALFDARRGLARIW